MFVDVEIHGLAFLSVEPMCGNDKIIFMSCSNFTRRLSIPAVTFSFGNFGKVLNVNCSVSYKTEAKTNGQVILFST